MNCQFLKNPHTHSRFYRFSLTDSFSSQINRLVCSELKTVIIYSCIMVHSKSEQNCLAKPSVNSYLLSSKCLWLVSFSIPICVLCISALVA
ncbi:hypothetical protein WDU94_011908 [Cyamophila willieti]